MALKRITAPPVQPITRAQAKLHLRIDTDVTDDDDLIDTLIAAATRWAEAFTGRTLITQTFQLALDAFPSGCIDLPAAPTQSITSIAYVDELEADQTLAAADYQLDTHSEPARLVPVYNTSWPTTYPQLNAVIITFVAGYAPDAGSPTDYRANVPANLIAAMKMVIAHLYEHRESVTEIMAGAIVQVPQGAEYLAWPERVLKDGTLL